MRGVVPLVLAGGAIAPLRLHHDAGDGQAHVLDALADEVVVGDCHAGGRVVARVPLGAEAEEVGAGDGLGVELRLIGRRRAALAMRARALDSGKAVEVGRAAVGGAGCVAGAGWQADKTPTAAADRASRRNVRLVRLFILCMCVAPV